MPRSASGERALLLIGSLLLPAASLRPEEFIRGDSNRDERRDVSDALFTLGYLFLDGPAPLCAAALDSNDDETIDLSDAVRLLGFLFLGDASLPPPGPAAGPDPTPGLGCGLPAPASLSCRKSGPAVEITFLMIEFYDSIEVARDGETVAILPGSADAYRDRPAAGGEHLYRVRGLRGGEAGAAATCRVTGLLQNRPPVITILSPQPGGVLESDTVTVIGRVDDDGQVARVTAGGIEAGPATPRAPPYPFQAVVSLRAGPNLVRIEAVDDFGRAAFVELPLGRKPLLPRNAESRGLALSITPESGYRELEVLFGPFLAAVPALLDDGVRGVLLFQGSVLGADLRVTGNRAEVSGPIGLDLFPAAADGQVAMRVLIPQVKLFADGRTDYGFLGTDNWTATWTGQQVAIEGSFSLSPSPDRTGLAASSSGFTVRIGNSQTQVSGFLDPFGIFDGVVNFLSDVFNDEIEDQIRTAVEQRINQEILPVLAAGFGGLDFSLNLGDVSLSTLFGDVEASTRGLEVFFDAGWKGAAGDSAFPAHPGSSAGFAPPPAFPLDARPAHPVDAAFSLSGDTLNQALLELAALGLLEAEVPLPDAGPLLPLTAGTLAAALDSRLVQVPGVSPEDPLLLRIEATMPPEIRLGEGRVGRSLVGEGAVWRYFKGRAEPPPIWKDREFDDSGWARGPSGFGYSADPAETESLRTLLDDMASGAYTSLYVRSTFELEDPALLRGLLLRVFADDGFVAYLNGREVVRSNLAGPAGTPPPFSALAESAVEPGWIEVDLAPFRALLRPGGNVLALQGHNVGASSTDFALLAVLLEPAPPPAGTFSSVPAQIKVPGLAVTFAAAPVGEPGGAPPVDLFSLSLEFRLQARVLLQAAEAGPLLSFEIPADDGPDQDRFPDAIVGGAAGIGISVASEAVDIDDRALLEFGRFAITFFGPELGQSLARFALPTVPLPELEFDLNRDGAPDARLLIRNATFALADTTGDGRSDWLCVLVDLGS